MYDSLKDEVVTIVISTRGNNLLEYKGVFTNETADTIELTHATIQGLLLSAQRNFFGDGIAKYQEDLDKVIINKRYIISCHK